MQSVDLRPSVRDAAAMLNLTTQRVHQLIREGKLPVTRTRLGFLLAEEDIAAFLEERETIIEEKGQQHG